MTIEHYIARILCMDEDAWLRHANPWSVILRNTVLPILVAAFWSRVWLGWWSLIPITLGLLWNWLNPRIFAAPDSLENWASRAVLGERIWLKRHNVPVPAHHRVVPHILSAIAAIGMVTIIWGVVTLDLCPVLLGMALVYSGKLWFLDRMVWLWEDMRGPR
ncbi:MAG: hypothetical protein QHG99_03600 [Methanomicrobiales archaeon]|nr:hypothetical protein [Methanomicrobiales archaeon]